LSVLYGHGVSVKKLNKLEILDGSSAIAGSTCMAAPWAELTDQPRRHLYGKSQKWPNAHALLGHSPHHHAAAKRHCHQTVIHAK
jgi:hypothetical protein